MKISQQYCKKQLRRVGQPVKIKRTLFEPGGMKQFTLEEALDYAANDKDLISLHLDKNDYLEIIRMLIEYKADKPKASKELVDTYFQTRWQLRLFTTRLSEKGHYYMSTKRLLGHFGIIKDDEEE